MMFRRRKKHTGGHELAPDEIFLDSTNLPNFDHARLEGRLEQPVPRGAYLALMLVVALIFVVLLSQAVQLTLIKGPAYAAQSEKNRLRPEVIFAERGAITDRYGTNLAWNESGEDGYPERKYRAPGFGHVLGYVSYPEKDKKGNYYDTEIEGLAGVEAAFNERLAGTNGTLLIEEDARGKVESQGTIVAAQKGETLTLSLDARVQEAFYGAIQELADRIPYKGGAGILMDVETGEVYALVSYPEYDPNILSSGKERDIIAGYSTNPRKPYLDRAVSGLYTPGSIVKPMIAAGAFNDGLISAEKEIVSKGSISIPNPYDPSKPTIFKDWKAHGATDMRHAIAVSSDVYFYTIGGGYGDQKGMGIERLDYWYEMFGFGRKTGIELAGENTGFIPTPEWKEKTLNEPWRIGNTYHTSIGQYSMQITLLEAVRAVAAIANGGKMLRPTLQKDAPIQGESIVISQEALQIAREGMRLGVMEGTSKGLEPLSYVKAAAKTGTAQLGVNNEFYNSWSVGFFPYDKPKYAWVVVMERGPAGNPIGGTYVISQVFSKLRYSAPEYFGLSAN